MELLKTIKSELDEHFKHLKDAGFYTAVIHTKSKDSLCLMFPQVREASAHEFHKLRELCNEYNLNMLEDKDQSSKGIMQYYYVFTLK